MLDVSYAKEIIIILINNEDDDNNSRNNNNNISNLLNFLNIFGFKMVNLILTFKFINLVVLLDCS